MFANGPPRTRNAEVRPDRGGLPVERRISFPFLRPRIDHGIARIDLQNARIGLCRHNGTVLERAADRLASA